MIDGGFTGIPSLSNKTNSILSSNEIKNQIGTKVEVTIRADVKMAIYEQPNSSSRVLGSIKQFETANTIETIGFWLKIKKSNGTVTGWINTNNGRNFTRIDEKSSGTTSNSITNNTLIEEPFLGPDDIEFDDLRDEKFNEDALSDKQISQYGSNVIQTARGIHGMPYQFLPSADRRLTDSSSKNNELSRFGRKYAERIVARMPLLLLTPGEPNYMTGFNSNTKAGVLSLLKDAGIGKIDEALENILNGKDNSGRYFTMDFAYASYYKYVNSMLRMAATFLDIHGIDIEERKGKKTEQLGNYDWSYYTSSNLPGVLSSTEYVAFYIDSENQISESFSNDTTQSVLASTFDKATGVANELKFIMGNYPIDEAIMDNDVFESLSSSFRNFVQSSPLSNNRLIHRLINDAKTVVTGGKLIFPEIWSDSSFSRSYDISIKLRTPDCDKLSWFLNIFVPLAHLICLTAPRQIVANGKTNPNAYGAPFLVRGFYKGIMSVEMGIISSMSISKGAQSAWTVDGLPTQVDVNFNLKDLYDGMAINQYIGRSSWALMKNTSMTDYIATSCGININKPDIRRTVDYWAMQKFNRVTDIPRHAWLSVEQALASSLYTFLKDGRITF